MRRVHVAWVFLAVVGVVLLFVSQIATSARQAGAAIQVDNDDLGGTVTGPKGPEAGRMGHCRNVGPAYEVRQDRRDG